MSLRMKSRHLFVSAVLVTATSLSGCGVVPNEPAAGEVASSAIQRSNVRPKPGILALNGTVKAPCHTGARLASIVGEVTYSLATSPYRDAVRVCLDLSTTARIFFDAEGTMVWTVAGESRDQFILVPEGSVFLEKSYPVDGPRDGMMLHLRFLLTTRSIELREKWLEDQSSLPGPAAREPELSATHGRRH